MYLIYNKANPAQFKVVQDYESAEIPKEWDAKVVSGRKKNKGELVAKKSPDLPLEKIEKVKKDK